MPSVSRSQQRLFGMVHAYKKGVLPPGRLTSKIKELAGRVSDSDAEHFAATPHSGLPETKEAQMTMRPDEISRLYSDARDGAVRYGAIGAVLGDDGSNSSSKRRSLLASAVRGALSGAAVGGLGAGALGAYLSHKATGGKLDAEAADRLYQAAVRCGLWGASRGAASGAAIGVGMNIFNRMR